MLSVLYRKEPEGPVPVKEPLKISEQAMPVAVIVPEDNNEPREPEDNIEPREPEAKIAPNAPEAKIAPKAPDATRAELANIAPEAIVTVALAALSAKAAPIFCQAVPSQTFR